MVAVFVVTVQLRRMLWYKPASLAGVLAEFAVRMRFGSSCLENRQTVQTVLLSSQLTTPRSIKLEVNRAAMGADAAPGFGINLRKSVDMSGHKKTDTRSVKKSRRILQRRPTKMATAKSKKDSGAAQDAAAQLAAIAAKPKINLAPSKKTASSATFTGTLTMFGLMTFPVKTYKATDEDSVSFNQVTKKADGTIEKLKQGSMTDQSGNPVAKENILKGFNIGNDKAPQFVVVTQEEIDAQKPGSDKTMTVTEFIDINDIDPVYYESTEFIAPDKGGEKPFSLIAKTLRAQNKVGKGSRVKGGRVQEFVIRPYGNVGLALSYLRTDFEVRDFGKWTDVPVSDQELALAATLVERTTAAKFVPAQEDKYLAGVRRMIEAKAEGVDVVVPTKAADPNVTVDLMAALQASLAATAGK